MKPTLLVAIPMPSCSAGRESDVGAPRAPWAHEESLSQPLFGLLCLKPFAPITPGGDRSRGPERQADPVGPCRW